jgi:LacI family transcriptional regulator
VEHLYAIGRRRIIYLGFNYPNEVDNARFRGYRTGLERVGLPFDERLVIRGANHFRGGFDAMLAAHASGIEADALFASNDLMGIGAMRYALTHGFDVPSDLAIVGFGGSDVASMVTPDLTTVSMPLYLIGVTAVQELLQLGSGTEEQHRQVNIEPELLIRGSTVAASNTGAAVAPTITRREKL